MATIEERVSALESAYERLATKADLHAMETRIMRWLIATLLTGMATAAAMAIAVDRLFG